MKNGSATGCITNKAVFRKTHGLALCAASIILALSAAPPAYAKSEIRALREQVRELRAKNEQLEAALEQGGTKTQEGEVKPPSGQQEKQLKNDSKALEYNKKIRELETFNKQLSGALAELERQNKALQQAQSEQSQLIGQAQAENQKLKDVTSSQEKLQQALQAQMSESERLKTELAAEQQRYAELEAQKSKAASEEVGQLQKSLAETQAENQKLKGDTSNLKKLQQALQAQMSEKDRLKNELGAQQQKYADLETQKNTASSELLGKQQQSLSELQTENRKLAQALADMTTKVVDLEKQQGNSQQDAQLTRDMAAQLDELNKKYAALEQENLALTSRSQQTNPEKLQDLIDQNKSLRETIRAQNDAMKMTDGASKQTAALEQENEELRQALAGSRQQQTPEDQETVKQLRLELATLQNELNVRKEQQSDIEELKQTVLALQEQNSRLQQGQMAKKNAALSESESGNDALGMAQVLQTQIEKEKSVNSEYRQKIREYQDQIARLQGQEGIKQPPTTSAVPAELAYDETVRSLMIQNQELKARIELMELSGKKRSKSKTEPEEKTSAASEASGGQGQQIHALKSLEGSALPQVTESRQTMTAAELLEVEPITQNVQLIRKNHTALPEMPPAQNVGEEQQVKQAISVGNDMAKAKKQTTAQTQYHIPKIEPSAGTEPSQAKSVKDKEKIRKNKSDSQTNG
ncbi:MAG: hypothetical protein KA099_08350 [Alphaproteobacteria bacterium]|nr:hypothetical protein [Alphaproteobacteria bacterium]MBP7758904.1 hypothetical protein [Alphaproteobacteria bacterium]MBP7762178.1 hypothetical protein [Alphaproteobacteria bacterium]MBP7905319.1 hypothetical protein [Alphaproteobacteria bacterium]